MYAISRACWEDFDFSHVMCMISDLQCHCDLIE